MYVARLLSGPVGPARADRWLNATVPSQAVPALDAVSFTLLQDDLRGVLATLSEREASIVQLRFGLTDGQPRTLEQIGHVHGVTRERIRHIETQTMAKPRGPSYSRSLVLRRPLH